MLKKFKESDYLLDVGCGVGTLTFYLKKYVKFAVGIDISSRAIEICNYAKKNSSLSGILFKQGILKRGKSNFDFILCSEVIEHIEDDREFLQILLSNLKEGGVLFLTTPSKENFLFKLGFYKKFDEEVGHYRRYRQDELVSLLENSGFVVDLVRSVEGPLRNILFTTKLGHLIRFIRGPLIFVFHFFDHISGILFGFSDIQIIATKK